MNFHRWFFWYKFLDASKCPDTPQKYATHDIVFLYCLEYSWCVMHNCVWSITIIVIVCIDESYINGYKVMRGYLPLHNLSNKIINK